MKLRVKSWAALSILVIVMHSVLSAQGLEVGKRFPEIRFPLLEGGGLSSVAAFRGRKLVLHIWASW